MRLIKIFLLLCCFVLTGLEAIPLPQDEIARVNNFLAISQQADRSWLAGKQYLIQALDTLGDNLATRQYALKLAVVRQIPGAVEALCKGIKHKRSATNFSLDYLHELLQLAQAIQEENTHNAQQSRALIKIIDRLQKTINRTTLYTQPEAKDYVLGKLQQDDAFQNYSLQIQEFIKNHLSDFLEKKASFPISQEQLETAYSVAFNFALSF